MLKGNSFYVAVHCTPLNAYRNVFWLFSNCMNCSSVIVIIYGSQKSGVSNDSVGAVSTKLHKNMYVHDWALVNGFHFCTILVSYKLFFESVVVPIVTGKTLLKFVIALSRFIPTGNRVFSNSIEG